MPPNHILHQSVLVKLVQWIRSLLQKALTVPSLFDPLKLAISALSVASTDSNGLQVPVVFSVT